MPCRGWRPPCSSRRVALSLIVSAISHSSAAFARPGPSRYRRNIPPGNLAGTGYWRQCIFGPRPVQRYPGFMHILLRSVPGLSRTARKYAGRGIAEVTKVPMSDSWTHLTWLFKIVPVWAALFRTGHHSTSLRSKLLAVGGTLQWDLAGAG